MYAFPNLRLDNRYIMLLSQDPNHNKNVKKKASSEDPKKKEAVPDVKSNDAESHAISHKSHMSDVISFQSTPWPKFHVHLDAKHAIECLGLALRAWPGLSCMALCRTPQARISPVRYTYRHT